MFIPNFEVFDGFQLVSGHSVQDGEGGVDLVVFSVENGHFVFIREVLFNVDELCLVNLDMIPFLNFNLSKSDLINVFILDSFVENVEIIHSSLQFR